MSSGWITLQRDLKDHWIFQDSDALKFWVYLLLTANHTPKKTMFNGKLIEVQRGSLIGGRMSLSDKTGRKPFIVWGMLLAIILRSTSVAIYFARGASLA